MVKPKTLYNLKENHIFLTNFDTINYQTLRLLQKKSRLKPDL